MLQHFFRNIKHIFKLLYFGSFRHMWEAAVNDSGQNFLQQSSTFLSKKKSTDLFGCHKIFKSQYHKFLDGPYQYLGYYKHVC